MIADYTQVVDHIEVVDYIKVVQHIKVFDRIGAVEEIADFVHHIRAQVVVLDTVAFNFIYYDYYNMILICKYES